MYILKKHVKLQATAVRVTSTLFILRVPSLLTGRDSILHILTLNQSSHEKKKKKI